MTTKKALEVELTTEEKEWLEQVKNLTHRIYATAEDCDCIDIEYEDDEMYELLETIQATIERII